jgi:hypothetical protein
MGKVEINEKRAARPAPGLLLSQEDFCVQALKSSISRGIWSKSMMALCQKFRNRTGFPGGLAHTVSWHLPSTLENWVIYSCFPDGETET